MSRQSWPYHILVFCLLALDQLTKALVVQHVFLYQKIVVIPGFANITRIHNRGAIFGAFSNLEHPAGRLILALVSLIALALVAFYYIKTPATEKAMKLSFALILSGALGNLTDRLLRGYVVDFIDLHLGRHHWPFFNLADSGITVGAFLLIIFLLWPSRRGPCSPSS